MTFTPVKYKLMNCGTGRLFEDEGWTLADPQGDAPALVRAVYEKKEFELRKDLDGFYKFANWLPIKRTLLHSHVPVTFKSKGLAGYLGLENLYITFSGYFPKIGARMETCSFKETEAYSVCARLPEGNDRILVVASAGNTARAFAKVCSDNNIPLLLSIPEDNISALWFHKPLNDCVKIIAAPSGCDYFDAIVYVPATSLKDYQSADIWKELNLQALPDMSGIKEVELPQSIRLTGKQLINPEELEVEVYSTDGHKIYSGTQATVEMPAGTYVIRCGNATAKAIFRQ